MNSPVRLTHLSEVGPGLRQWEADVADLENLTNCRMDESRKTQALLKLVPFDLEEMVASQEHMENSFDRVRMYLLNQVGRKQPTSTSSRD